MKNKGLSYKILKINTIHNVIYFTALKDNWQKVWASHKNSLQNEAYFLNITLNPVYLAPRLNIDRCIKY